MGREIAQQNAPTSWRYECLGSVSEINPPRDSDLHREHDAPTTFVPMSAVDDRRGLIARAETRPFSEVQKGYTYFREGDVVFAKITPCMQNGKHAIGRGCIDGIGFASTEFHVVRAGPKILPDWIHLYLRQPRILAAATAHLTGAVGQQRVPEYFLCSLQIPVPPMAEQEHLAALLRVQLAATDRAYAAAEAQLESAMLLPNAIVRETLISGRRTCRLADCLREVTRGVGTEWRRYPVLGATRAGLAPAKEPVGKNPERYKLVERGTVFYNPMRILLGSIACVDDDGQPGITSPDYVVLRAVEGVLHFRWFYYWLRSPGGEQFIKSATRGAVRERLLFRRLAEQEIEIPAWEVQVRAAEQLSRLGPLRSAIAQQMSDLTALRHSVIAHVFGGQA